MLAFTARWKRARSLNRTLDPQHHFARRSACKNLSPNYLLLYCIKNTSNFYILILLKFLASAKMSLA